MGRVRRRTAVVTLATALSALVLSGAATARTDEAPTGQERAAATAGHVLASALARLAPARVTAAQQVTAPQRAAFSPTVLTQRLAKALTVPHVSAATSGAVVVDLDTGEQVFEQNADRALVPASNEKLAVAYAALVR